MVTWQAIVFLVCYTHFMKLQRFFVAENIPQEEGSIFTLNDVGQVHQIMRVFRMKKGDQIILCDNSGWEYSASIQGIGDKLVDCVIGKRKKGVDGDMTKITLVQAIIKKDRFEWLVEKATEIGVAKIIPCITERTEKKALDIERLRKIAREAAEQSERTILPEILEPISMEEAAQLPGQKVFLDFNAEVLSKEEFASMTELTIYVGPEGGWTDNERKQLGETVGNVRSLSARTLRAETAAIAAVSKLLL